MKTPLQIKSKIKEATQLYNECTWLEQCAIEDMHPSVADFMFELTIDLEAANKQSAEYWNNKAEEYRQVIKALQWVLK